MNHKKTVGDYWKNQVFKKWLISKPNTAGNRKFAFVVKEEINRESFSWRGPDNPEIFLLGYSGIIIKGSRIEMRHTRFRDGIGVFADWYFLKDKDLIAKLEAKLAKVMLMNDSKDNLYHVTGEYLNT